MEWLVDRSARGPHRPQEVFGRRIGRFRQANLGAQCPHNDRQGWKEIKILRDNMPFGRAGEGEFGTYFIGYSRSPNSIELMLENMFVGRPPGNYDRLLDFSRAVTGSLFFVPSVSFLESINDVVAATPASASDP